MNYSGLSLNNCIPVCCLYMYLCQCPLACKLFRPQFNMAGSSASPHWWLSMKKSWIGQALMLFVESCYDIHVLPPGMSLNPRGSGTLMNNEFLMHDKSLNHGWGNHCLEGCECRSSSLGRPWMPELFAFGSFCVKFLRTLWCWVNTSVDHLTSSPC